MVGIRLQDQQECVEAMLKERARSAIVLFLENGVKVSGRYLEGEPSLGSRGSDQMKL